MTTQATQRPTTAGTLVTSNAAASGDKFQAGDHTFIRVHNADVASHTVTATVTGHVVAGDTATLPAVAVAAGASKIIGPFPRAQFGDADGLVSLTWSATTSMSWEVFSV